MATATDDPKLNTPPPRNPATHSAAPAPLVEDDTPPGDAPAPKTYPGIDASETDEALRAEATRYGWTPKDKYKGQAEWMDFKDFVSQGRQSIPILRGRLAKNETAVARLQQDYGNALKDLKEAQALGYKIATQEWTERYNALKAEKAQALADGEHNQVVEVDEALKKHDAVKPTPPKDTPPPKADDDAMPAEYTAWFAENEWYNDSKNRLRANVICAEIIDTRAKEKKAPLEGVALFEAVKAVMQEEYPETFGTPSRTTTHRASRRTSVANPGARTYDNLPQAAKEACNRFVARGQCTKEQYVANFAWPE